MIRSDHKLKPFPEFPDKKLGVENDGLEPTKLFTRPKLENHFCQLWIFVKNVDRFLIFSKNQKPTIFCPNLPPETFGYWKKVIYHYDGHRKTNKMYISDFYTARSAGQKGCVNRQQLRSVFIIISFMRCLELTNQSEADELKLPCDWSTRSWSGWHY